MQDSSSGSYGIIWPIAKLEVFFSSLAVVCPVLLHLFLVHNYM
jgi:hypothetical protein